MKQIHRFNIAGTHQSTQFNLDFIFLFLLHFFFLPFISIFATHELSTITFGPERKRVCVTYAISTLSASTKF